MVLKQNNPGLEAEQAVIGSMLIDPACIKSVLAAADANDFTYTQNRMIFQSIQALFRAGRGIDALTVFDRLMTLKPKDPPETLRSYLAQLIEITPTSANVTAYVDIMRKESALFQIRELSRRLSDTSAVQTLDDARPLIASLSAVLSNRQQMENWSTKDLIIDFMDNQSAMEEGQRPEYIRYGFRPIDEGTFTEPGDVVMICGYPSDGKTALGLMLAYQMAQRYDVGFFSLETDKKKIRDRLVTHAAQISFGTIKRGTMTETDWDKIANIAADFEHRKMRLFRAANATVSQIAAVSQAYGFKVIVIDYVQLIQSEADRRGGSLTERMSEISMALHTFAQSTGTLVIELAQLSRQNEKGKGGWREPEMSDIRQTGQFEQDADTIFMIFRPGPKSGLDRDRNRILKIVKNKEGRLTRVPLCFDGDHQTFTVMERSSNVARTYSDAGRKAKIQNRTEDPGQMGFEEIPADFGNSDMPF